MAEIAAVGAELERRDVQALPEKKETMSGPMTMREEVVAELTALALEIGFDDVELAVTFLRLADRVEADGDV